MAYDVSAVATEVLFRLGATSWADLDWATQAEVYSYFDEAAQRLAEMGLFVYTEGFAVSANVAQYTMPATWLDSIHVSVNNTVCRPSSVADLIALDGTWTQIVCETGQTPARYSMDAGPLGTITLYPQPSGAGELTSIDHVTVPTVAQGASSVAIPSVVGDYLLYFALARLRGKESPYQMPEIAASAMEMCALYEQVFTAYWGNVEP